MVEITEKVNLKVLVSNNHLVNFAGSEINTFQLCSSLRKMGYVADAATFTLGNPIKELFEKENIPVFNLLQVEQDFREYDIIWAHHISTINQIVFNFSLKDPRIIFSSLSPYEPLEAPPIYFNKLNKILSISMENKNEIVKYGIDEGKIIIFPNYAPMEYFQNTKEMIRTQLKKIAVISNHPPSEIRALYDLMKNVGIDVDYFGINDEFTYIDDKILKLYDLIISIGKTIQYCFALKVPVYCYDRFGGPGFLDEYNFQKAGEFNFSGRGFSRILSSKEIFDDILFHYDEAIRNLGFLYDKGVKYYVLEDNISKVLKEIVREKSVDIDQLCKENVLAKRNHEQYMRLKYQIVELQKTINRQNENLEHLQTKINLLSSENGKKERLIQDQKREIDQLSEIKHENNLLIDNQKREILYYALSKSWRFTRPLRKVMNKIRGLKGKNVS